MKAIEVQASGLVCDNPECDYRKDDIAVENYGAWVGALCPDCGEPLLTEEQYEDMQAVLEIVNGLNEIAEDPLVAALLKQADENYENYGRKASLRIKANREGGLQIGEIEWQDN